MNIIGKEATRQGLMEVAQLRELCLGKHAAGFVEKSIVEPTGHSAKHANVMMHFGLLG